MEPSKPQISLRDIVRQFWLDIFGKEVQSAATYSYMWIADQVGHLAVGIIVHFLFQALLTLLFGVDADVSNLRALLFACVSVGVWEWFAYQDSVKQATDRFPLNKTDLRANAVIATVYMCLGAAIGAALKQPFDEGLLLVLVILIVAAALAPDWIRQKMIWQKAALPYLFRLANAKPTISQADADRIQAMIEAGAPPDTEPQQIIVAGPIGSGTTSLGAGIGTEYAFRGQKVRYLSFANLTELAESDGAAYPGPRNICYWRWREAQVLIVDDISTAISLLLDSLEDRKGAYGVELFEQVIRAKATRAGLCPNRASSIWIVGDVPDPEPWADAVQRICDAARRPLVVQLDGPANPNGDCPARTDAENGA